MKQNETNAVLAALAQRAEDEPEIRAWLVHLHNQNPYNCDRVLASGTTWVRADDDEFPGEVTQIEIGTGVACPPSIAIDLEMIVEALGADGHRSFSDATPAQVVTAVERAAHARIVYGVSALLEERGL